MKRLFWILIPVLFIFAAYEWGSGLMDAEHMRNLQATWTSPSVFVQEDVIKRQEVTEGKTVRVLYNYKPLLRGHLLIIPKRQVLRVEDLTDEEWREMLEMIRKMHIAFVKAYHAPDYLLVVQNGIYAGQTVPHVHMHMIPRDGSSIVWVKFKLWQDMMTEALGLRAPLSEEEQKKEIDYLKKFLE